MTFKILAILDPIAVVPATRSTFALWRSQAFAMPILPLRLGLVALTRLGLRDLPRFLGQRSHVSAAIFAIVEFA